MGRDKKKCAEHYAKVSAAISHLSLACHCSGLGALNIYLKNSKLYKVRFWLKGIDGGGTDGWWTWLLCFARSLLLHFAFPVFITLSFFLVFLPLPLRSPWNALPFSLSLLSCFCICVPLSSPFSLFPERLGPSHLVFNPSPCLHLRSNFLVLTLTNGYNQ